MTKDSSAKRKTGKRKPEKLSFTQDFIPIKNLEHGIIETTGGRYIKILEIEPINFMLRSEEEQYEIICSFASWLKISPVHLQFKSITRKADSDKHIAMLRKETETEESEQCKKLSEGYIRLIKDVGSREALTRRFFLIFRYEELRRNENSDYGQICSTLLTAEQNARAYFMQCGNNILQPKDPDEATAEILYMKTLGKVEAKLSRMKEQAAAVRWFYENGNLPESYNRALRLEELSEQAVLLTRVLPAYTGAAGATIQTDAIISDTIPVEVGFTAEGWFSVRIPALLPKKASGSADYIRSYLYPAMRKFFEGKPPVRFRDCVLAYRHVYDRSRPERAMRDHDNIETNMVTDILALYVLPDDHPAVCSHYYCSAAGSEDRTEVYVIPKHDFPMWMVEEKTLPDKGVKLYEVRFC